MYTKEDFFRSLDAISAPRDSIVLVHSSLRCVGPVEGGGQGFLDVLIEYFTAAGGLLCIPTHTWHNLGREITLDMTSEDNCLGMLSTLAIRDGRGLRTESPTHSMVIFGPRQRALDFASGEAKAFTPTSPDTCYGRLYSEDGYVLLVGVAHNRNTYLHAVDELLGIENRMEKERSAKTVIRYPDGKIVKRDLALFYTDYTEDISDRFVKFEIPFRYHKCGKDTFLGNAPAQLLSARKMKEVVEMIYRRSKDDPLRTEQPIPPQYYVK